MGWRRTSSSPTGSGPEGSSPNDQKSNHSPAFNSLTSAVRIARAIRRSPRGRGLPAGRLAPSPGGRKSSTPGSMAKKKSDNGDTEPATATTPEKPYVVLARKYRPATFDELIGQSAM